MVEFKCNLTEKNYVYVIFKSIVNFKKSNAFQPHNIVLQCYTLVSSIWSIIFSRLLKQICYYSIIIVFLTPTIDFILFLQTYLIVGIGSPVVTENGKIRIVSVFGSFRRWQFASSQMIRIYLTARLSNTSLITQHQDQ
jgi:hypothetical protein